jgi:dTDP-L-rhamnose 4-epimerase
MNVLITGGAGFIGSHLARALVDRGCEVTILDNLSVQVHGPAAELPGRLVGKVRLVRGDVRSREAWSEALQGQELVVHLAAETGTGQSMYEISRYVDVNIGGTGLMLDVLANSTHSVRRVLVASSRAIYGEGKYDCARCGDVYPVARSAEAMKRGDFEVKCPSCGANVSLLPTDEASKIHPSSLYGITKQAQEQMVMTVGSSLGLEAVALRYQNVYGPGQSLSNPYTGILSIFSTRIRNGHEILVFEDGTESRDFVYIDDVVKATIACIEHPRAAGEVFNVGSGIGTDVALVALSLVRAYDADVPVRVTGNFRVGDIRHNVAALAKIRQVIGFEADIDFPEGVRRFAQWVSEQAVSADTFEKSVEEMRAKGLFK